jgi:hypothetical protein
MPGNGRNGRNAAEKLREVSRGSAEGTMIRLAQKRNNDIMIENYQNSQKLGGLERLSFPLNVASKNPTWVKYDIWKYVPTSQGGKALSGSHFNAGVSKKAIATIALSSDAPVTTTENQGWKQEGAGGVFDQMGKALKSGVASGLLGGEFKFNTPSGADMEAGLKEGLLAASGIAAAGGVAMVEKMALKYDGPEGLRSFTMTHIFVPRNKKESDMARNIILAFRAHSAPPKNKDGVYYNSYKFPSVFTITQMVKEGPNLNYPKFATCYCKSVTAKFGDATNNTFADNDAPTTMELTLQFEEIAIVDRSSILAGG